MTDVLRNNFKELIPVVISKIEKCTFVAIDAEYTGLFSPNQEHTNSLFDTPSKRYEKLRMGFSNFQISQFGLAVCKKDWDTNRFFVTSYNFYLYPVSFYTFRERATFRCQVSSFNFLAANHFDFNKFIKEGIPYLGLDDAVTLRNYLKKNRHFMNDMEVRDQEYFPRFTREVDDDHIEEIVQHLTGFSKVIYAIQEFKKPVVGHNMLMDLILIYQQFYRILPDSYEDFKSQIHKMFPVIYDTKSTVLDLRKDISTRNTINSSDSDALFNTTLLGLYKNIMLIKNFYSPIVDFSCGSLRYRSELETFHTSVKSEDSHYHEAGFDACVTAAVFIYLSHISFRQTGRCPNSCLYTTTAAELFANLSSYENHVNIVRSTSNFLNISGPDPIPTRPNWIKVECPNSATGVLTISWLRNQLPKFGDVDVEPLDSRSFILACSGWGCAKSVWKFLSGHGYTLSALEYVPYTPENSNRWTGYKLVGFGLFVLSTLALLYRFDFVSFRNIQSS